MAKFVSIKGEVALSIKGDESLPELEEAVLDYARETMEGSAVGVRSWWSVIEQNEIRNEQVGWLTITVTSEEYVVEHFTLDKKPLSSDWSAHEFYAGKYDQI